MSDYQTWHAYFPEDVRLSPGSREHTLLVAHYIRDHMDPDDRAYWGTGKLSYPQSVDLLAFHMRGAIFFDVPPEPEGVRVKVLQAEIARLKRKAGEA